jgi:hypothetical protein
MLIFFYIFYRATTHCSTTKLQAAAQPWGHTVVQHCVRAIIAIALIIGPAATIGQIRAAPPLPFVIDFSRSDLNRAARTFVEIYAGPLVDTHSHFNPPTPHRRGFDADVLQAIAKANVDRIILQPPPNEGRFPLREVAARRRLDLERTSDGRVLIMCGSDYLTVWMESAARSKAKVSSAEMTEKMGRLARDLRSGRCCGVGEIGVLHFNTGGNQPVVQLPAAYPPLLAIAEITAAAGVPIEIHAEPIEPNGASHHDELYSTIALMFERAPGLRLIYAHHGLTNVNNARALLKAFPNLMMNLSYRRRPSWSHLEPVTNERGELYSDWAALLEEMPERFMIGSDFLFGWIPDATEKYTQLIDIDRRLLGSLEPAAARRIAYENAVRVFGQLPK